MTNDQRKLVADLQTKRLLSILSSSQINKGKQDMKLFVFVFLVVIFELNSKIILARPPKGGIGDGYIYPVKNLPSKPKATTTYYAKPIHPPTPAKKHSGPPPKPKAKVYKVIIQNQTPAQPQNKEQIFKVIRLSKNGGSNNAAGGSAKILKIIHLKQQHNGGHGSGGWAK